MTTPNDGRNSNDGRSAWHVGSTWHVHVARGPQFCLSTCCLGPPSCYACSEFPQIGLFLRPKNVSFSRKDLLQIVERRRIWWIAEKGSVASRRVAALVEQDGDDAQLFCAISGRVLVGNMSGGSAGHHGHCGRAQGC